ncbi:MAG: hypothetical protein L7U72_02830 [Rubripirellula sp.]|nr:hypothetical protein [Rubripirellula sp.]
MSFVLRVMAFLVLQLGIGLVIHQHSSTEDSNHYLAVMRDKIRRIQRTPGERVIILGGSNTVFGMHSPVIEANLERPVVNLGLHISLGLEFPMRCYLPHARRGDIVVLCPEYHVLSDESQLAGDPVVTNQLIEQWPKAKKYLPAKGDDNWKNFLDHDSVLLMHQWVHRSIKMIRGRDQVDKVYRRSSFNEHGDLVAHYGKPSPDLLPMAGLQVPDDHTLNKAIETLNQFASQCRDRGVVVYFAYPPFARSTYDQSLAAIEKIQHYITKDCAIPTLNHPADNVHDDKCFFDSSYHLQAEAGQDQTTQIADAIARNLLLQHAQKRPEQPNASGTF